MKTKNLHQTGLLSLFGLFCLLLSFSSCSSDDNETTGKGKNEIRLTSSVQTKSTAYQGSQIANGQQIGVFIEEDNNSPETYYDTNLAYIAGNNGSLSGSTQYYPTNGRGIKLTAYHPYNNGTDDTYSFAVQTDQSTVANIYASDLMYAGETKSAASSSAIKLNFKHKLVKLQYSLTAGEGNPDLTGAEVTMLNTSTSIDFNRKTGELSNPSNPQDVKLNETSGGIIVPQTIPAGTKLIQITLPSGKTFYYTTDQSTTLEKEKAYLFKLKVNLNTDQAIMIGTEVDDWTANMEINGEANEEEKLRPLEIENYWFTDNQGHYKYIFTYDDNNRVQTINSLFYNSNQSSVDNFMTKLTYNEEGQIVSEEETATTGQATPKKWTRTYDYSTAGKVKITELDYAYEPVKESIETIYIDEQGKLSKKIVKEIHAYEEIVYVPYPCYYDANENYQFDDAEYDIQKNPYTNVNLPKWYIQHALGEDGFTGKNNLVRFKNKAYEKEYTTSGYGKKFSYTYYNQSLGRDITEFLSIRYERY